MYCRHTILSLALLVLAQFTSAAVPEGTGFTSDWVNRAWQTDDGLPDNSVTGVMQTDDGYLWAATIGGLIRFNGAKFEEFSLLHIPGVANRIVRKAFLDRSGRMWLAMNSGSVVCLGTNTARVFNQDDGLEDLQITGFAEDAQNSVWILDERGGLCRLKDGRVTRFGAKEGFSRGGNPWIASDEAGELWYARGSNVGVVRDGKWRSRFRFDKGPIRMGTARGGGLWICAGPKVFKCPPVGEPVERAQLADSSKVTMVFEDHAGTLWIGTTTDGLFRLDGDQLERVKTSHEEITCAMEDREGNLWIGTQGGGLDQVYPRAVDLLGADVGLPSKSTRSICQDAEGWIWVAMSNDSLARGRSNHWNAVTSADGWPGGRITCVAAARDGGIWIGTIGGGLQFLHDGKFKEWRRDDGLGSDMIRSLLVASNDDVWVATQSPNRLVRFRNGEFFPLTMPDEVRNIRALAEGVDGTIWAGSSDGQLLRVNGAEMISEPAVQGMRPMSIRSLDVTPDGRLLIGYASFGLGCVWDGKYVRLTMDDGLHDDYISQIQSDDHGGMWFIGNRGLSMVRQEELAAATRKRASRVQPTVFGRSEGLTGLQASFFGSPNSCRSDDGNLFFATRNGLLRVQPNRIQDNTNPPPVVLERVTVDDHAVALWQSRSPLRAGADTNAVDLSGSGATLRLAPGHRKLEFEFSALSFASPENVKFRYRLDHYDEDWTEAESQRMAKYPRLPAGRYNFHVQACNNAGIWNRAGFKLPFEVTPFVWQTWWFRLLVLTIFTAVVAGLARYFFFRRLQRQIAHLEQQAAVQKDRARIAQDLHDDLGAGLTEIGLLASLLGSHTESTGEQKNNALERIVKRARYLVPVLDEIVWAVNPRNDSARSLCSYFSHYAQEFFEPTDIRCRLNFREGASDSPLSSEQRHNLFLAFKEALTNVARHSGASEVRVSISLETPGRLEVLVEDNGRGLPEVVEQGADGLINLRQRLESLRGECKVSNLASGGVKVRLTMPLAAEKTLPGKQ
jgi:signal transduction histidine kinase/ligand-binding sensor domain-containing protein